METPRSREPPVLEGRGGAVPKGPPSPSRRPLPGELPKGSHCLFPLANLFIFNTLFQEGMGCQLAKCLRISPDSLERFYKQFLQQSSSKERSFPNTGRWPGHTVCVSPSGRLGGTAPRAAGHSTVLGSHCCSHPGDVAAVSPLGPSPAVSLQSAVHGVGDSVDASWCAPCKAKSGGSAFCPTGELRVDPTAAQTPLQSSEEWFCPG